VLGSASFGPSEPGAVVIFFALLLNWNFLRGFSWASNALISLLTFSITCTRKWAVSEHAVTSYRILHIHPDCV
jgi:hypothetical protein